MFSIEHLEWFMNVRARTDDFDFNKPPIIQ